MYRLCKVQLQRIGWQIGSALFDNSRGDLTDKLRGMIVKRMKETGTGPADAGRLCETGSPFMEDVYAD
ncbi:hypothetical protein PUN28_011648 [Cardiocondyla obscurior]|uniref:Uncharacterized protein n=1 Tax=Cardiocondyla obscurior TaxID=286306 RepID=A0AAW2FJH4_9HYME